MRVDVRNALVQSGPFSTAGEFRSFNALLLDMATEVVAGLPAVDVLARFSDRARHLVMLFGMYGTQAG